MECPKCKNNEFDIKCYGSDIITYRAGIDVNGFVETYEAGNEDIDGTDWFGNAICNKCNTNIEIKTWKILPAYIELRPLTVFINFVKYSTNTRTQMYAVHVYAEDLRHAIEKAIKHSANHIKNVDGETGMIKYHQIIVLKGHIEDLTGGLVPFHADTK